MEQADLIWHNGELVAWEDAKVHVLTHGLHYGTGVFEGDARLRDRAGTGDLPPPRSPRPPVQARPSSTTCRSPTRSRSCATATHELIAANELRECYIRPIVFRGYGQMGLYPLDAPVEVSIAVVAVGRVPRRGGASATGVRAKVSSWRRIPHDSLIPHAKACGQYLNSVLAKIEASKAGYQEAILLDSHGFVCEGTGENIYVVRDGVIVTPPQTAGILDGINRRSVIQIARDLGYEVVERDLARAELYLADEVFMTGTAAELVPVREIDDHAIGTGERGPITREIQRGVRRRAARPRPALRGVARRGRGALGSRLSQPPPDAMTGSSCTTRPCATGCRARACRCPREEKLRVAHRLDELGIDLIEAGFPSSNPKELELFELLGARALRARARSRPSG